MVTDVADKNTGFIRLNPQQSVTSVLQYLFEKKLYTTTTKIQYKSYFSDKYGERCCEKTAKTGPAS